MGAIDFRMDLQREADPNGGRVRIGMSGRFLPCKSYRRQPVPTAEDSTDVAA